MDSQEILAVHSILHLIFHRNKNQHHRTKWWKWLSILKRATLDLTRSNAVESQKHLATYVIPRCYIAFSTVIADNQFSTLGIVLLAAMARLSKITGISHQMKIQPAKKSKPISVVKEDLGERIRRVDVSPLPVMVSKEEPTEEPTEKAEKLVEKLVEKPAEESGERSSEKLTKKSTVKGNFSKNPPKKRKKKNAIDDLFSGLF